MKETNRDLKNLNKEMIEMIIYHFAQTSKNKDLKKVLEQSNLFQYFMKNFDNVDVSSRCLLQLREHYSEFEYRQKIHRQNVPQKRLCWFVCLFSFFCKIFC